jgi:hypothetical protein
MIDAIVIHSGVLSVANTVPRSQKNNYVNRGLSENFRQGSAVDWQKIG